MSNFRGIWIALVTPMRANEIDFPGLEKLVKKLLEDGVTGFVVCGTTGEAAALSKAEQLAVLDAVLAWVAPGQVVMGLSGYNLRELLAFQAEIQQRDIGGLLVPAPCYIRPSQAGIEARIGLADLVLRPGLLSITRTHVDVWLDPEQADMRIRRAGLDLDPGWVPWLGRVVCFHYDRDPR